MQVIDGPPFSAKLKYYFAKFNFSPPKFFGKGKTKKSFGGKK
jgi:hypothetical protein